jgi:hypothetical protein
VHKASEVFSEEVAARVYRFRKRFVWLVVFCLFVVQPGTAYSGEATISDLVVSAGQRDLLVHFRVNDCFTKKMEEAILAGIPTTFTFMMELYRVRFLWFDKKLVEGETKHTVKYDTVKKIFYVTFSKDGLGTLEFTDFESAKKAMEEVNAAALLPLNKLERNRRYCVRVKARLDKVRLPLRMEYVFFFVSLWDFETDWYRQDFIYR